MISINLQKRFYTSLFLLLSVFLIFNFNGILIYTLIVFGVISILEFMQLMGKILKNKVPLVLTNLFFIIYIFLFCFMFFLFSNLVGLKIILFILLIGCIASDIGGFIFGKIFKGPKLTKISPKKTYAGAVGSIILTTILISSLFYFFLQNFNFKIIIISVVTSIFCQIGDLLFSFLKRKAKLKDTGKILPGHGGILDRIDGILLGIPIGFISLVLVS